MKKAINPIIANLQERREVAQKSRELKDRAGELRQEHREVNKAFISEQLEKFVQLMHVNPESYIYGSDSTGFTKFVNRSGLYLNPAHNRAIYEFNQAKENLAEVFIDSIMENKNNERETIINHCGIKNIQDMEHYFN